MNVTYSILINQPPEIVFQWIADPEKAKQWQENVKSSKIIESPPGIIGTKFIEEVEEGGNSLEMKGEVTEYIDNQKIGFHIESSVHDVQVRYSVEPVGAHSLVSVESEIHWKPPMNIFNIFTGNQMKENVLKQLKIECNELNKLCDTQ